MPQPTTVQMLLAAIRAAYLLSPEKGFGRTFNAVSNASGASDGVRIAAVDTVREIGDRMSPSGDGYRWLERQGGPTGIKVVLSVLDLAISSHSVGPSVD